MLTFLSPVDRGSRGSVPGLGTLRTRGGGMQIQAQCTDSPSLRPPQSLSSQIPPPPPPCAYISTPSSAGAQKHRPLPPRLLRIPWTVSTSSHWGTCKMGESQLVSHSTAWHSGRGWVSGESGREALLRGQIWRLDLRSLPKDVSAVPPGGDLALLSQPALVLSSVPEFSRHSDQLLGAKHQVGQALRMGLG